MKPVILIALSLLATNVALAAMPLTLSCHVVTSDDVGSVSDPSITFDADKGYKDLTFKVYDSDVSISAVFFETATTNMCGNSAGGLCVTLKGSQFCSGTPSATLFPTDEDAEPGDRTDITCTLKGGDPVPCASLTSK